MLNGLYGYIFGAEEEEMREQENMAPCSAGNMEEEDWCLVDGMHSGRSSPVLVPQPDIQDIDALSLASKKAVPPPSPATVRRAEQLRQARAQAAHKQQLEKMLFAEVPSTAPLATSRFSSNAAARLKRGVTANVAGSESKIKPRSKKTGKLSSGRNNDRKVNNLD